MIYDMRMKIYGLIIIALLMGACSSDKPSKKCIYPAGDLFFSKEKASWSEVYIDKEYADTVLVTIPRKRGFVWKALIISRRSPVGRSDTPNRIGI